MSTKKLPSTKITTLTFTLFFSLLCFSVIYFLNYPLISNTLLSTASTLTSQIFFFAKNHNHTTSTSTCDMFNGKWVMDDSYPIYEPGSCPYVEDFFNCYFNGRSDLGYTKYRWQPYGCHLPRFDAKRMMEMLRGKRLVFVGDSLNRNMYESLVCLLKDFKGQSYKSGERFFHTYLYDYKDYNCSIIYLEANFLVQQQGSGKLRLDILQASISDYHDADFLIFNTGHWWNHNKAKNGENFFQEGDVVHSKMDVGVAYTKALNTWAKWVDNNVNTNKTQVFYAGLSISHFIGGGWEFGGTCDKDKQPITDEKLLRPYPWMMQELEKVISRMKTPVYYLNISKLTDSRKDAHPSIYRHPGTKPQKGIIQDCSHWCLPGVPDSWNQLLFASLLLPLNGLN